MSYHRPGSLDEALRIKATGPCRVLAGGTDLYPATDRPGLTGNLLDITGIPDLRGIEIGDDGVRIGAATTWAAIARDDLPPFALALQQAAREVGSVQIQNAATLAGNLCNASPAADGVPPLLTLDAAVEITSASAQRIVPLSDFILGNRRTDLRADELVTAILLPAHACTGQSAFAKLGARKYLVISISMVAVRLELVDAKIAHAAIAVGACSEVARRLPGLETALVGADPANVTNLIGAMDLSDELSPIDDIRASASFRRDVVAPMLTRAIGSAAQSPKMIPA